jgi:hypothetical protein
VSPGSSRIGAIVLTDLRVRLRRTSSLVTLLFMVAAAYIVVPDLASGRAIMVVDGHRALYNSAAIATSTSLFATMFLGFMGFYLVSNALRRDLETRTGFIIAATPVRNSEYLAGKFLGNVVFLGAIVAGYMLGVMVMHLLRAEEPLQPLVYLSTYMLVVGPAIIFVAVMALLFESVPPLAGRLGDIAYFFVWLIVLMAGVVGNEQAGGLNWHDAMDAFGMAFVMHTIGATSFAIGATPYDPLMTPIVTQPLHLFGPALVVRGLAALAPLPLLLIPLVLFHRFDPVKVKDTSRQGGRGPIARLNQLLKPVTRVLAPVIAFGGRLPWRFGGRVIADAAVTLALFPLALLLLAGIAAWSLTVPMEGLRGQVLPALFFMLVILLPGITTRDGAAGTLPMLNGIARLRVDRLAWKLATAFVVALLFALVPLLRLAVAAPSSALALLVGLLFTAALSTALGELTRSPKTFAGLFLFFLYLVLNGRGAPAMDFAGWFGTATPSVMLGYLGVAAGLTGVAWLWGRIRTA